MSAVTPCGQALRCGSQKWYRSQCQLAAIAVRSASARTLVGLLAFLVSYELARGRKTMSACTCGFCGRHRAFLFSSSRSASVGPPPRLSVRGGFFHGSFRETIARAA